MFTSLTSLGQIQVKENSFRYIDGFVMLDKNDHYDINDKPMALIKISTENITAEERKRIIFKGNLETYFDVRFEPTEIYLYLSAQAATFIEIHHPDYGKTEYTLPYDLKGFCGYEMVVQYAPIGVAQKDVNDVKSAPNAINGHEYVDLGLPSGLKWATCNVGASSPEEYGDYFAWGETKTKSEYVKDNSVTYGKHMGDISGNSQYDAATANWGGTWRLPTKAELEELMDKCTWTWTWTTKNRVKGYKVTGPNGNSIFLPATGVRVGSSLNDPGGGGSYWSSSPGEGDFRGSYFLVFGWTYQSVDWTGGCHYGHSVRPVTE